MGMAALGHIFPEKKQPTQTSFLRHASGIGSLLATSSVTAAVSATIVSLLRALRPPGGLPAPATVHLHPAANMVFPKHKSVFPLGPKTKVERPPHLTLRRLPAGLGVTPRPHVAAFSAHWLTAAASPPLNTLDFLRSPVRHSLGPLHGALCMTLVSQAPSFIQASFHLSPSQERPSAISSQVVITPRVPTLFLRTICLPARQFRRPRHPVRVS